MAENPFARFVESEANPFARFASQQGNALEQINPAEGMTALQRGIVGAGGAARKAYLGVRSLIPGMGLSPQEREELKTFEANQERLGAAGTAGGVLADIGMMAIPGTAAARLISGGAAALPLATRAASAFAANAASDAALSAAMSPENRAQAAQEGAIGSVIGQSAARALSRFAGGLVTPSNDARSLMRMGVQPTIGQGANQGSFLGRRISKAEESLQSVPIMGDIISSARQRPQRELVEKAFERAVPPGGTAQEVSRKGIERLFNQFDQAYAPLKRLNFNPDAQFDTDVLNIVTNPNFHADKKIVDRVLGFVDANFSSKFRQGVLSGEEYKNFDSEISRRIRDLARVPGTEALAERRILTAIENSLTNYRNRQLPADLANNLAETDRAYAALKRISRAGSYSDTGEITPAQLTRAVKAMTPNKDVYARGQSFMQEITDPGAILRSRTPNSGTADRLAEMSVIASMLRQPVKTGVGVGGALTIGNPMYTRPAQRFLLGGYDFQQALADAIRNQSALSGTAGAAIATE